MGTSAPRPERSAAKRIGEEFVAWLNSIKFENDEEQAATLREILSETSIRLQMAEED